MGVLDGVHRAGQLPLRRRLADVPAEVALPARPESPRSRLVVALGSAAAVAEARAGDLPGRAVVVVEVPVAALDENLLRRVLLIGVLRDKPLEGVPAMPEPEGWVTHYSTSNYDYRINLAARADGVAQGRAVYAFNGWLPGRIHVGHNHCIRARKHAAELVEQVRGTCIAVWLEYSHDAAFRPALPRGGDGGLQLGWVMPVIFDRADAALAEGQLTDVSEAPADALERGEAGGDLRSTEAEQRASRWMNTPPTRL